MGERHRESQIKKKYREIASLDAQGRQLVATCSHCGAKNTPCHKHRKHMCDECGKLYERWRKAVRLNIQSELALLKPKLLQKYKQLQLTDKTLADKQTQFFKKVEQTEVTEMERVEPTSKVCKQCGRLLEIEKFRKYVPRGRGVYETNVGRYTICKDCESISNRAIAALKKNDEETLKLLKDHYQTLSARGLPPVTSAARRVMGIEDKKSPKEAFVDLLAEVSGRGGAESTSDSDKDNDASFNFAVYNHCENIRNRAYANADEAYEAHRHLAAQFTDDALLSEMNELIEEWYDDEENV